jgi:membrane protein DedA with SNARE-associated domain
MGLLEHYGGPAVFLGRFVAFARAFIPGLAGMSGLRYRTFFVYNAIGGVIWGVGYTLLGYVVGLSFEHIVSVVGRWSLLVVGVVVVAAVVIQVVRRRREGTARPATGTDEAPPDPPGEVGGLPPPEAGSEGPDPARSP